MFPRVGISRSLAREIELDFITCVFRIIILTPQLLASWVVKSLRWGSVLMNPLLVVRS